MNFYPDKYLDNVLEISPELLKKKEIQGIILDIDNTLIDKEKNMLSGVKEWIKELKNNNIKVCIVSNTNKKLKAEKIAQKLNVPYIFFAMKPLKKSFNKAKRILEIEDNKHIAVIGDQIMTDVFGANRSQMYSILVKPISKEDITVTKINRVLEKIILKKYNKKYGNKIETKADKEV